MEINRREFIHTTSLATAGLLTNASEILKPKNKLPRWKGFNFLDFFSPAAYTGRNATPEIFFQWMSDWGFDFMRIPMAYPSYLKFDRSRNILPEEIRNIDTAVTDKIEQLVYNAQKHGIHVCLNLHRAPGYCVNAGFHEPYNLWTDAQALDDFCYHWEFWAKRYQNTSNKKISFDLLNEPSWRDDMNDQLGTKVPLKGEVYRKVVAAALHSIKSVNKNHLVIADGNNKGRDVTPELADLDVAQSCRGYVPAIISHYKASWVYKDPENLPTPVWPGKVGEEILSRKMLEDLYAPWIKLMQNGVGVHCGECGCFNKTPHEVFLAWFTDLLDILKSNKIGFALWEFKGAFGLIDSGRTDVAYEDWHGYKLDRKLLTMLQKA
jgi:aryl-phospho-beta-D-glucosidase BglC (GH1 family)